MEEPTLRHLLAVLGARGWLVVLLALPVLAAGAAYAAQAPPAYRSEAVHTFSPGEARTSEGVFIRQLPRFALTATAPEATTVAERAAGLPPGALRGAVSADLAPATLQLTITVIAPTPEASLLATRSLSESLTASVEADDLARTQLVQEPTLGDDSGPRRRALAVAVALLLAPVPGTMLAIGLEGARPRVRLAHDLTLLGVPVLQTVRRRRRWWPGLARREARASRDGTQARLRSLVAALAQDVGSSAPRTGTVTVVLVPVTPAEDVMRRVLGELPGPEGHAPLGQQPVRFVPSQPVSEADRSAVGTVRRRPCLLVVPTGTHVDLVQRALVLLDGTGSRVLGAVLVR